MEQQVSLHRGMSTMMGGQVPVEVLQQVLQEGGLGNAIFLHLEIHRNNLLDESLEKLNGTGKSLKSPLKIKFIGEPGDDAGGPRK